jgi:hypothetical protein
LSKIVAKCNNVLCIPYKILNNCTDCEMATEAKDESGIEQMSIFFGNYYRTTKRKKLLTNRNNSISQAYWAFIIFYEQNMRNENISIMYINSLQLSYF